MASKCELSGTRVLYGNNVSHSERKTRRRFAPNTRIVRFKSDLTGDKYRFKINARCIRSVEKNGGFDQYMLKVSEEILSARAKIIKRKIVDKKSELHK